MAIDKKALNGQAKQALKDGLVGLPDGKYEFEVTEFAVKEFTDMLKVVRKATVCGGAHDGRTTGQDWDTFLIFKGEVKDRNIQQLTKELEALGFPAEQWAADEKWFDLLEKASSAVVGLRFKGTKKASTSGEKTYQNLYVDERLLTDGHPVDGKPRTFTEEDLEAANRTSVPF
jgi:hypothetical protein